MIPAKQNIICAAIDCFSGKSFALATMQDIADHAKIRTACLFRHYAGKESLLVDVMEYYQAIYQKKRLPVEMVLGAVDDRPISEVLPTLFYTLRSDEDYQAALKASRIMAEAQCISEPIRKLVLNIQVEEYLDYLHSVFSRLITSGRVRQFDYESLSFQMVSFSHTVFELLADGKSRKYVEQIYRSGIAFFAQGLENMLLMDALHYAG